MKRSLRCSFEFVLRSQMQLVTRKRFAAGSETTLAEGRRGARMNARRAMVYAIGRRRAWRGGLSIQGIRVARACGWRCEPCRNFRSETGNERRLDQSEPPQDDQHSGYRCAHQ